MKIRTLTIGLGLALLAAACSAPLTTEPAPRVESRARASSPLVPSGPATDEARAASPFLGGTGS
jgi:hypothetical protein